MPRLQATTRRPVRPSDHNLYDSTMTVMTAGGSRSFVVLDDDPTGVQTLAGVRVLLDWDARARRSSARG